MRQKPSSPVAATISTSWTERPRSAVCKPILLLWTQVQIEREIKCMEDISQPNSEEGRSVGSGNGEEDEDV